MRECECTNVLLGKYEQHENLLLASRLVSLRTFVDLHVGRVYDDRITYHY
ncbi:hypothetical protein DOY81_011365 [Sarcophaga bullata]|nr:hypothetical protein DOY81_011365 [Sarcophaga bullata]